MAQEKARQTRARKTVTDTAKKAPAKPRVRRTKAAMPPAHESIATHAYHLWERGEPGDPDELWLRAERELAS